MKSFSPSALLLVVAILPGCPATSGVDASSAPGADASLLDREFALRPLLDVAPELAGHFEGAPRS